MKGLLSLLSATLFACCMPHVAMAQNKAPFDPETATIEENIRHPEVSAKHTEAIASAMSELITRLREAGFKTTGVRSGLVAMVTIPCADIFAPNSTDITSKGKTLLAKLRPIIENSADYKVIVAVHSDNTGDSTYADRITADRANAIDQYYYHVAGNTDIGIIPYGLGSDEPVAANQGTRNRAKNRRVEFYFVPTEKFISENRKQK